MSKLLRFFDFLARRVQIENLELLRRIAKEFYGEPRSFTTVERMLQLSFPVITVVPQSALEVAEWRADDLPAQPPYDGDDNELVELQQALQSKLLLYNWDWLLAIYADFCQCHERSLREFLRLHRQSVSVLPVPPPPPPSAKRQREGPFLRAPVQTAPDSSIGDRLPDPASSQTSKKPKREPASPTHHLDKGAGDEQSLLDQIDATHFAIERKKPWERIFRVSDIEYPFDGAEHPEIARALQRFWARNAQAVWERNFWYRFPPQTAKFVLEDRKNRQRRSADAFEATVMVPLFKALGAEFFVQLDERSERHHWWWYRGPVIDLFCIQNAHGLDACLQYQQSQANARIPVIPDRAEYRKYRHRQDHGASMWSTMVGSQHIAAAVRALKLTRSASPCVEETAK